MRMCQKGGTHGLVCSPAGVVAVVRTLPLLLTSASMKAYTCPSLLLISLEPVHESQLYAVGIVLVQSDSLLVIHLPAHVSEEDT